MHNQDNYVDELQQILDECVVALGSKALRWDEIAPKIRSLREQVETLQRYRGKATREIRAENAKLKADADGLRGAIHHKDSEYIDACGELDELEAENVTLRELVEIIALGPDSEESAYRTMITLAEMADAALKGADDA